MKRKAFNVVEAEKLISFPMQIANHKSKDIVDMLSDSFTANVDDEKKKIMKDIVNDMYAILQNTEENKTGMHIVKISSDNKQYDLVKLVPDETGMSMENVGTFKTYEEAEEALNSVDKSEGFDCFINEYDPDKLWDVLDDNDERVFVPMFPTKVRAMAFLLNAAKPDSYLAYKKLHEELEKASKDKMSSEKCTK